LESNLDEKKGQDSVRGIRRDWRSDARRRGSDGSKGKGGQERLFAKDWVHF